MDTRPGFLAVVKGASLTISELGRPATASRLLSRAEAGGIGVLLLGRIHYLERREDAADVPSGPRAHAAVVLEAYRRDGMAALERLEGEFSLALWDIAQRRLLAMRNPLGSEPAYWVMLADGVAVSTAIAPLLTLQPTTALDSGYLADILCRPVLALQETRNEATCHRGISRILPGTILDIDLSTRQARSHPYWSWPERIVDPGTSRTDEIAGQVADTLRAAVHERIAGCTGAHFSGGMDSTAIALLARDHLQRLGSASLHTLSFVYDRLASLAFEADYVREALDGQAGLTSHLIKGDDILSFDGFADGGPIDEPYAALVLREQDRALFQPAIDNGCAVVLSGEGGDDVLDVAPYHIASALGRGRIAAAWGEARRWARAHNVDPWPMLRSYGIQPLIPARLRGGWRALLTGGLVGWREQGEGTIPPWVRPEFARRHDMRARSVAHLAWLWGSHADVRLAPLLAAIQCRTGEVRRQVLASPADIALTHPFLDARMLRLGLGIRQRYVQEPERQKPLLADAMRGVLPDAIRQRRAKGNFNEVYFKGLARNRPVIEQVIREAPIDDLGLIDKAVLIDGLRKTALGVEVSGRGMMQLNLSLSLVQWLAKEPQLRRQPLNVVTSTVLAIA